MGIITWIIFGLIAGAIAKMIMPGKGPGGCLMTIVIGIAGAFVGGFLGTILGFGTVDKFDIRSLAVAIAGSLVLLFIYSKMKK